MKEETPAPEDQTEVTSEPEVVAESVEGGKVPPSRGLRIFKALAGFLFFFLLYLSAGALAVGAGVGWHYLDANHHYDLDKVEQLAAGAEVVDSQGRPIGRIGATDRRLVTRAEIPNQFIDALLAAEDQRFFLHPGFDPMGTLRAAIANYRAESIQEGGSTLTQQLARDVFGLEGRHIERKLNEIALAVWIEQRYSKDEILVHYLNRIYFGSGFYGVGAAARGYFGKALGQLSVDESAMLCGLIRSPSRFSPFVSRSLSEEARNQTLNRMVSIGRLSAEEREDYLSRPTPVADNRDERIHRGQTSFLLSRVEKESRKLLGDRSLEGLRIQTSVDLALQQAAAFEMDQHLKALQKEMPEVKNIDELEGAIVVIENKTGEIVLTVGSRDFQGSEFDRSLDMKRPPGSAFFPFVYAAAFQSGKFRPDSDVVDAPFDNREMGLGGLSGVLGEWSTENPENRWEGRIPASRALSLSKNSPTARLGLEVGLDEISRVASAAGIESTLRPLSGSILGASEMSLSELTHAYAIFPNQGEPAPALRLIRAIFSGEEKLDLPGSKAAGPSAISAETAGAVARLIPDGKSGTTSGFTDAWHFGFNERYTWGIWVGKDTFEMLFPLAFGSKVARPVAEALLQHSMLTGADPVVSPPEKRGGKPLAKSPTAGTSIKPTVPALIGPDPYGTLSRK